MWVLNICFFFFFYIGFVTLANKTWKIKIQNGDAKKIKVHSRMDQYITWVLTTNFIRLGQQRPTILNYMLCKIIIVGINGKNKEHEGSLWQRLSTMDVCVLPISCPLMYFGCFVCNIIIYKFGTINAYTIIRCLFWWV